jgi:hypothetical protein
MDKLVWGNDIKNRWETQGLYFFRPPRKAWTLNVERLAPQKITSGLLKDLDAFARNGITDELASLDPLLRNMDGLATGGGSKLAYDYDGMP